MYTLPGPHANKFHEMRDMAYDDLTVNRRGATTSSSEARPKLSEVQRRPSHSNSQTTDDKISNYISTTDFAIAFTISLYFFLFLQQKFPQVFFLSTSQTNYQALHQENKNLGNKHTTQMPLSYSLSSSEPHAGGTNILRFPGFQDRGVFP